MEKLGRILQIFYPLSGRLSRGEYARKCFRYVLALLPVWLLAIATKWQWLGFIALVLTALAMLSTPFLAAQRCRDLGWSGWAFMVMFVPWGGAIFEWYIYLRRGMAGPNRYGPDPYAADGAAREHDVKK